MDTITLAGTCLYPDGTPADTISLTFKLLSDVAINAGHAVPTTVTATTAANGTFSVTLVVPASGSWLYRYERPFGKKIDFWLGADSSTTFEVVIASSAVSGDTGTLDGAIATHAADTSTVHGLSNKADKAIPATALNLAALTATGNLADTLIPASWNATAQTMNIKSSDEVTIQVGQEVVLLVRNNSGADINNGDVVTLSGSVSDRPTIALAQADSISNAREIGMATEDIANNTTGFITIIGLVRGLNTSAHNEGDVVWLSTSTPGALTATQPTWPAISIEVGRIVRKNATDGIIFVGPYETGSNSYQKASDAQAAAEAASVAKSGDTMSDTLAMADNLITRPEIKDYAETVNALGDTGGGAVAIDLEDGNIVTATVSTSTTTFTFSNPSATGRACSFTLELTNGGSQTVNWPAGVTWAGGTAPTLTTSGVDVLTFYTVNAGTAWRGFAAGLDMQ